MGTFDGILMSLLFLTAAVVAASRPDLKELARGKWNFALLIFLLTALVVGVITFYSPFYNFAFVTLVILDIAALASYLLMRKMYGTVVEAE